VATPAGAHILAVVVITIFVVVVIVVVVVVFGVIVVGKLARRVRDIILYRGNCHGRRVVGAATNYPRHVVGGSVAKTTSWCGRAGAGSIGAAAAAGDTMGVDVSLQHDFATAIAKETASDPRLRQLSDHHATNVDNVEGGHTHTTLRARSREAARNGMCRSRWPPHHAATRTAPTKTSPDKEAHSTRK
jgi:hypothetical protein